MARFSFGKNWTSFAETALSDERVDQAREHFLRLVESVPIEGKRFVDVGFGQGLIPFFAAEAGAKVSALDVDSENLKAIEKTQEYFALSKERTPKFVIGSILEQSVCDKLTEERPFDVVHSWGVLHHTGDMYLAIRNAISLCARSSHFVLAIYNRHWTSPIWLRLKQLYNCCPRFIQEVFVRAFYPLVWIRSAFKGEAPTRGMEVLHDIRDWLGGIPYEYASKEEITTLVAKHGFQLIDYIPASGWTGCNQFVFARKS